MGRARPTLESIARESGVTPLQLLSARIPRVDARLSRAMSPDPVEAARCRDRHQEEQRRRAQREALEQEREWYAEQNRRRLEQYTAARVEALKRGERPTPPPAPAIELAEPYGGSSYPLNASGYPMAGFARGGYIGPSGAAVAGARRRRR